MYANISRIDDDVTVSFGWRSVQSQSTQWWSIALLRSTTRNGTYTNYESTTRTSPGSVPFDDVTQGRWYMASVMGCDEDNVCSSVNSSKIEVPSPTPTPTDTPTAIPSGTLTASPPSIGEGATTTVTASNIAPQGQSVKVDYPDPQMALGNCDYSRIEARIASRTTTAPFTGTKSFEFKGCLAGTYFVRLFSHPGDAELARVTITVLAPTPTPTPTTPTTPTPTPSGSLSAPVEIVQYGTTTVTASNLSPAGTSFKIAYPDTLRLGNSCGGGGGTKATVATLFTSIFNKTSGFVFIGCNLGLHTLKLLTSTDTKDATPLATTTINVVTPTPTPQPTDPPTPTPTPAPLAVDIATVIPGWNSALFQVNYPANSTSTTVKEVTLTWKQNTGTVCSLNPFACKGGTKLGAPGLYKLDRFTQDSVYTFTATMKVSITSGGKTTERTFKDTYTNVRTLAYPTVFSPDEYVLKRFALGEFNGSLMNVFRVDLGVGALTSSPIISVESPPGTGLQVMTHRNESCDWAKATSAGNPRSADASSLVPDPSEIPKGSLYLGRCGMGDGKTKLKIKAKGRVGTTKYDIETFETVIQRARHQSDHIVKYDLGTRPLTATPAPNFPAAIATAAAMWNGISATTTVRFCEGLQCDGYKLDSAKVRIDFVTPIPTPFGVASSSSPTTVCGHGNVACLRDVTKLKDAHIGNQEIIVPHPLTYSRQTRQGITYLPYNWTDVLAIARRDPEYRYLQAALMHELGHAAGIGHSRSQTDVMGVSQYDPDGLEAVDKKAMEVMYKGHNPNH